MEMRDEMDVLQTRRAVLLGWCRVQTTAGPVQMATLRTRDYSLRGAVVFAIRSRIVTSRNL